MSLDPFEGTELRSFLSDIGRMVDLLDASYKLTACRSLSQGSDGSHFLSQCARRIGMLRGFRDVHTD